LIFVLASDNLQAILNQAMNQGHMTRPFSLKISQDLPVIQYVDYTLIILPANQTQLIFLKNLLMMIGDATSLKVNYGNPT
jgi:hypothetical protein